MCRGMEENNKMREVSGAIKVLRATGTEDKGIIDKIVENFNVTKEYVMELLEPKTA